MTYIVHGATGAQGAPVVAALRAAGKPVVAVARKTASLDADLRSADVDYGSIERLTELYRGADGVFVHLPIAPPAVLLGYAENIAAALAKARPARVVVSTSGAIIDQQDNILQQPHDGAVTVLVRRLADAGISHAVVAPLQFLENLLLPPVIESVRGDGVLRYPLRADLPVSWVSHLDVANAAAALFESDRGGIVAVGLTPPITGPLLAEGFSAHFGKPVRYEALSPEQFGKALAPMLGEFAAADIASHYTAVNTLKAHSFAPDRSAQTLLGLTPRSVTEWLAARGVA